MTQKFTFDDSRPETLCIKLNGDWRVTAGTLSVDGVIAQLTRHPGVARIRLEAAPELLWDNGLIDLAGALTRECAQMNIHVDCEGLPPKARKLIARALKTHEKKVSVPAIGRTERARGGAPISGNKTREQFLETIGGKVSRLSADVCAALDFLGDIAVSLWRLITGKSYFPRGDFMRIVQNCGAESLMLVSLISLLVGMILAFVGSIQLKMFGAQIFIADIVGIAMVRVLAAVMTGIILSGRIGASFAAELGMMQANDEIDALKTFGVSPVEFLVVPRVLALVAMMPALTVYADVMGIAGGFIISVGMLHLNPIEYLNHTHAAVKIGYVWVGLTHSLVFGVIIAFSGCLRGMYGERNAAGVGMAATSAVVTAITGIVIATAIITFICQILGV